MLFGEELQIVCNVRVFEGTFVNSSGPTTTSSPVVVDFDEEDQQEADDPDLALYEMAEAGEVEWPESAAEDNSAQELLRPAPEDPVVMRSGRVRQPREDPNFLY